MTEWDDRKELGVSLKELIMSLTEVAKDEISIATKLKICHCISYMCQTLNSIISSENEIGKRLDQLEELAGISRKNKLTA